jgi:hypothetical protein
MMMKRKKRKKKKTKKRRVGKSVELHSVIVTCVQILSSASFKSLGRLREARDKVVSKNPI